VGRRTDQGDTGGNPTEAHEKPGGFRFLVVVKGPGGATQLDHHRVATKAPPSVGARGDNAIGKPLHPTMAKPQLRSSQIVRALFLPLFTLWSIGRSTIVGGVPFVMSR